MFHENIFYSHHLIDIRFVPNHHKSGVVKRLFITAGENLATDKLSITLEEYQVNTQ